MRRQYRIDVTRHLKLMGNAIRVTLKPAAAEALKRKQAYPYEVPFVQVSIFRPDISAPVACSHL